ncbi:MAG: MMPL family transporter, partial [Pseudomonadales bacterium]
MAVPRLNILERWVGLCYRRPIPLLLIITVVTLFLARYAADNFSINAELNDIIQQDAPWRQDYKNFKKAFPDLVDNLMVVVQSSSRSRTEAVAAAVEEAIRAQPEHFHSVFNPQGLPFIQEHALLFLSTEQLHALIDELAAAQPALARLTAEPSLRSLLQLLEEGLQEAAKQGDNAMLPAGFFEIVSLITDTSNTLLAGKLEPVQWRDRLLPDNNADSDAGGILNNNQDVYQIVFAKGLESSKEGLPNAEVMQNLSAILTPLKNANPDVRIRVTGDAALSFEEIQAALDSVRIASLCTLLLLALILAYGLRSLRLIVLLYLCLLVGLTWTAAFAEFAVGQYNALSLVFVVIFIGLGVDFAIHILLRIIEALSHISATDRTTAMRAVQQSTHKLGPPIILCAVTTALGFLSFVPTEYAGLAALGKISAGGMFIAVFVSFSIIPAFLALFPPPTKTLRSITGHRPLTTKAAELIHHLKRPAILLSIISACVSLAMLPQLKFDFSVLALKDPNSSSVSTLLDLQQQGVITDYSLAVPAANLHSAEELATRLRELPSVLKVQTPLDLLPKNVEEKEELLFEAQMLLQTGSERKPGSNPNGASVEENTAALERLLARIQSQP